MKKNETRKIKTNYYIYICRIIIDTMTNKI